MLLNDPSQQMRYGYVSGNPMRWVDPMGLVIVWSGDVKTLAIAVTARGAGSECHLSTADNEGSTHNVVVGSNLVGVGFGVALGFTKSKVTFIDSGNDTPNPNAFSGLAVGGGFSWALIGGFSVGDSRLGSVKQDGGFGGLAGYDGGVFFGAGTSWVMDYSVSSPAQVSPKYFFNYDTDDSDLKGLDWDSNSYFNGIWNAPC